jgi:adenosylmethionine-8-amino-7-oxononanoate aminotransferase
MSTSRQPHGPQQYRSIDLVIPRMGTMDYPIWHGSIPMEIFIERKLRAEHLLVEGNGIRVRDQAGHWYIDARSSCWNLGLGYSAEKVKEAIRKQLDELPNANVLSYDRPAQVTLDYARALRDAIGSPTLRYIRLGNTGSQMTETAVMLSRLARVIGGHPERNLILSFEASYHGMGISGCALSGVTANLDFCGPLAPGVHHISAQGSWADNVRHALDELSEERVTAVIFEPQMGTAGIIPDPDDLRALARVCREADVHLIADEVTTGAGRTGAMSRCLDLGIDPDMLVLSKSLTSGYVPIAALLVSTALYELAANPDPPRILPAGSATDGHPVACAAGLAVLDTYQRDDILAHVRQVGAALRERLETVHAKWLPAGSVEGAGLMIHFPLLEADGQPWAGQAAGAFRTRCEENGLLLSGSLRGLWVVPPLVATEDDCAEIASIIGQSLEQGSAA